MFQYDVLHDCSLRMLTNPTHDVCHVARLYAHFWLNNMIRFYLQFNNSLKWFKLKQLFSVLRGYVENLYNIFYCISVHTLSSTLVCVNLNSYFCVTVFKFLFLSLYVSAALSYVCLYFCLSFFLSFASLLWIVLFLCHKKLSVHSPTYLAMNPSGLVKQRLLTE